LVEKPEVRSFSLAPAPAADLAALYHERWEIEGALAELKTHLRGAQVVLRTKIPDLVRQEFWGLLPAHAWRARQLGLRSQRAPGGHARGAWFKSG